jgi:hypothetical protein
MSAGTARAVSMGLLGGSMAVLLFSQGLVVWAAFVAWAMFLAAGGGGGGLKSSITNTLIGAVIGWAALVLMTVVFRVTSDTWLWMPRTGLIIADLTRRQGWCGTEPHPAALRLCRPSRGDGRGRAGLGDGATAHGAAAVQSWHRHRDLTRGRVAVRLPCGTARTEDCEVLNCHLRGGLSGVGLPPSTPADCGPDPTVGNPAPG